MFVPPKDSYFSPNGQQCPYNYSGYGDWKAVVYRLLRSRYFTQPDVVSSFTIGLALPGLFRQAIPADRSHLPGSNQLQSRDNKQGPPNVPGDPSQGKVTGIIVGSVLAVLVLVFAILLCQPRNRTLFLLNVHVVRSRDFDLESLPERERHSPSPPETLADPAPAGGGDGGGGDGNNQDGQGVANEVAPEANPPAEEESPQEPEQVANPAPAEEPGPEPEDDRVYGPLHEAEPGQGAQPEPEEAPAVEPPGEDPRAADAATLEERAAARRRRRTARQAAAARGRAAALEAELAADSSSSSNNSLSNGAIARHDRRVRFADREWRDPRT